LDKEWPRDELFKLYQIAVEEYRFEVKLNTDRMIHYVVANSVLLSIGAGLLKIGGAPILNLFVACIFVAGGFASYLGIRAIRKGHEYYHRTVRKKTIVEDLLGLTVPLDKYHGANLAIGSTRGQAEVLHILNDPDAWLAAVSPRKGSIVHTAVVVLLMLLIMDMIGATAGIAFLFHPPPYIPWP
jgi:hypothetical protein